MIKDNESKLLYKKLPRNFNGRDFVIGDLHGCISILENAMDKVGFDKSVDRLMSVGDLIDRGQESLRSLSLLREPWFHSVLSNHESMFLSYRNRSHSSYHVPNDFIRNGGRWVEGLKSEADLKDLVELEELILKLPVMLIVDAEIPFNVIHGDLLSISMVQSEIESNPLVKKTNADCSVWSRKLIGSVGFGENFGQRIIDGNEVLASMECIKEDLNITFAGHTTLKKIVVHNSHVFIDQGAFLSSRQSDSNFRLTMINTREFCNKLKKSCSQEINL